MSISSVIYNISHGEGHVEYVDVWTLNVSKTVYGPSRKVCQVLLDVEDDTAPMPLQLLKMDLKTTTMAVKAPNVPSRALSIAHFCLFGYVFI